jgi:hypothetical protein
MDQTESWTQSNGGWRLARTIRRNTMKTGGSTVETPNAFEPGEESIAEQSWHAHQTQLKGKNRSRKRDLLLDHREADPMTDIYDEESLRRGLIHAYGDSAAENGGWVNIDGVIDEFWDENTDVQEARRYFLNQITHASDSWLSQPELAAVADPTKVIADRDVIVLGFDGSRGRAKGKPDATALIGCRVHDGHLFEVNVWEAPDGPGQEDWTPPLPEIDAAIDKVMGDYTVVAFYADPAKDWRSKVGEWEAKYGAKVPVKVKRDHPFEWWMTGGRSHFIQVAVESFSGAVRNREVTHSGEYRLTQHVLNARRRIRSQKLTIGKEHDYSPHKVDACVAAILAWQARLDAIAAGFGTTKRLSVPTRVR